VGYDWVDGLKKHAEKCISEEEWEGRFMEYPRDGPSNKEQFYLRKVFRELFPSESAWGTVPKEQSVACSTKDAISWNKEWVKMSDISGRTM
jgi:asparagine synthase (glutamine-hydrolysing)